MSPHLTLLVLALAVILIWVVYDVLQKKHAIIHNFPIIGHFRYWLEMVGPELRQYIVTSNDEERPFCRDERRWVYASSKRENNYFGFGTDNDLEMSSGYLIIRQSAFPLNDQGPDEETYDPMYAIPCRKVIGEYRQRPKAFRPNSVINIAASGNQIGGWADEFLARTSRSDCTFRAIGRFHHDRRRRRRHWRRAAGLF